MRPTLLRLCCLILALGASAARGDTPVAESELRPAVERYFEAMAKGDGAGIRAVFHPDAQLFGVFGGSPVTIPLESWIERIEGDPKPAPDAQVSPPPEDGVEWRIVTSEIDGDIARVVVRDRFLGVWYTDYLTFLQAEGQWRIVNKTFTYDKKQ